MSHAFDLARVQREPIAFLETLYGTAVRRAHPAAVLAAHLPPPPKGRTLVLGAGKASGAMAAALDAAWPSDVPLSGLVITRYDHTPPAYRAQPGRIEVVEAAHPVPDAAGEAAARRTLDLCKGLTADDLVICLISGGGSALLAVPASGLTLDDKRNINGALLRSGATIGEMNCVRKHLSGIKGGRLAAACAPAQVMTLLISDVPGDDPSVIASGPTVADPTTCADALAIIDRYRIEIPPIAREALLRGEWESVKPGDLRLARADTRMLATPREALEEAARVAREAGLAAYVLSDDMEGEAREVGKVHAALARSVKTQATPFRAPCVILSGGETSVTVRNRQGRGGRAVEFLLGCGVALDGLPGVWGLAADTDGIDGTEGNAGAWLAPDTLARARALGQNALAALESNDAYSYFASVDHLVTPGPTFTNVNDFRALLVL
ncbi:glycerate kinase [Piscinibacterium candidicorallinum]|uniref:Glycerate kinase n=1 Tax=Piscinibacterium candidicorallinum TaxID=1793872 RepID=A0ABV7HC12_9BURK